MSTPEAICLGTHACTHTQTEEIIANAGHSADGKVRLWKWFLREAADV